MTKNTMEFITDVVRVLLAESATKPGTTAKQPEPKTAAAAKPGSKPRSLNRGSSAWAA